MKTTNTSVDLAVIANDISYIKADVKDIKTKLEMDYVTKQEFDPIKKIVYGLVTLILTGVVGAVLSLILKK
jgi:hypothetical protein